ncbi:MAG TPA: nitrous oxide reductase accessory protein NosL [Gemmatimonadales bacterium]|nr:nitrous oxide reductase accessory protein NosL [Gemmatimonadales bacterium]
MSRLRLHRHAAALLGAVALACGSPGPVPIAFGEAACDHCHMTIVDQRFAAELVTRTGKVYAFDDAGCLATFTISGPVEPDQVRSAWVTDFRQPGTLIPAQDAIFLRTEAVRTPMSSNLLAVPRAAADSLQAALGGTLLDWPQVLAAAHDSA